MNMLITNEALVPWEGVSTHMGRRVTPSVHPLKITDLMRRAVSLAGVGGVVEEIISFPQMKGLYLSQGAKAKATVIKIKL